ncbi:hypothetical protein [Actinomadura gamaensis]|uniref:Uncharacterized protein n=1 Tax=Actinomadura gamaensis TaxID=1763541 RepID=A0ABV9U670_9ACTN
MGVVASSLLGGLGHASKLYLLSLRLGRVAARGLVVLAHALSLLIAARNNLTPRRFLTHLSVLGMRA